MPDFGLPDAEVAQAAQRASDRFRESFEKLFSKECIATVPPPIAASKMSTPMAENLLRVMTQFPKRKTVVKLELAKDIYERLRDWTFEQAKKHGPCFCGDFTSLEGIPVHVDDSLPLGMWKEHFADGREVWNLGPYNMIMPERSVLPGAVCTGGTYA